jgi:hypothetical protein
MTNKIKSLIEYVQFKERVCPMPNFWHELWKMLPDCKQNEDGTWNPPLPLILAAWWDTTDDQKRERLTEHINYADKKMVINRIDKWLRLLKEEQWLHRGEIKQN